MWGSRSAIRSTATAGLFLHAVVVSNLHNTLSSDVVDVGARVSHSTAPFPEIC